MKDLAQELVYVDHAAIVSNDWNKLQLLANQISSAIADWVLILSALKTNLKVMAQPKPGAVPPLYSHHS